MKQSRTLARALFLLCIFVFGAASIKAQTNTQKVYDLDGHIEDSYAMIKNGSNEFVIVTSNELAPQVGANFHSLVIVVLDSCLDTVLVNGITVNGADDPMDHIIAHDIIIDDTNYVLCGEMEIPGSLHGQMGTRGFAMKLDPNYNMTQFRLYDNVNVLYAVEAAAISTDYLLAGDGFRGAMVFNVTNTLNTTAASWNICYPSGIFYDMARADGDHAVLTGFVNTVTGGVDVLAVKVTDGGMIVWESAIDNPDQTSEEIGRGIYFNNADEIYITGSYSDINGLDVLGLQLTNGSGLPNWGYSYDLNGTGIETGQKLLIGDNGNVRITGNVSSSLSGFTSNNGFMIETEDDGKPVEAQIFGTNASEELYRIEENGPNDFVMIGNQDTKTYGVQSFYYAYQLCEDTVFKLDTIDIQLNTTDPDSTLDDLWDSAMAVSYYTPNIDIDTLCDGCVGCEPTEPLATYYHVVDTVITGVLQRMMNEGDLYSNQENGSGVIYSHTLPANNGDILVVNAEENGTIKWSKSYGSSNEEVAYCVRSVSTGGFIVAGMTVRGKRNPFLMKLDANGDKDWIKTYEFGYHLGSLKMIELSDGSFVVASCVDAWNYSQSNDDVVIFKTDANGELLRQNILTQSPHRDWDHFTDLVEAGDYIVAVGRGGQLSSDDYNPGLMVKFNKALDVQWTRHYLYRTPSGNYNLTGPLSDRSHVKLYAVEYASGKYYAAGVVSNDGYNNAGASFRSVYLMEVNPANGNINWDTNYLDSSSLTLFQAFDLRAISGGFAMVGNTKDGADQRSFLMKVNSSGGLQWARRYGDGKRNMATYVHVASDGKFHVTGFKGEGSTTLMYPFHARLNSSGTGTDVCDEVLTIRDTSLIVDTLHISLDSNVHDSLRIHAFDDEQFCVTIVDCEGGSSKWSSHGLDSDVKNEAFESTEGPFVYPNPVVSQGTIRYSVTEESLVNIVLYDVVTGRPVRMILQDQAQSEGTYEVPLDGADLASGTYICSITINGDTHPVKVVLLH